MRQQKTVKVKIMDQSSVFDETLEIYNEALSFLLNVMYREFDMDYNESTLVTVQKIEKLVHVTKNNPTPKYNDFNVLFHKFPSYLRREAISSAYGKWQSWRSNYLNWQKESIAASEQGKKFTKKAPIFSPKHKEFPFLYKGNMYKTDENETRIKVFKNKDWVWQPITLRKFDLSKRGITSNWKQYNPKLIKKGKKYFLHFAFEKDIKLHKKSETDCRILSIDLGLTNTAVCSVMDSNGTVIARKFVKQAREKDHFYHLTNQLKKAQRNTPKSKCPRYWNRIKGLQTHMVNNTAHQMISMAMMYEVDTIVFEYLGKMRMPKGFYGAKRLRFKLHYWRKQGIQSKIEEMAHYYGMRISRVVASGTSKFAYDGSGEVKRSKRKDLCTFVSGKQNHADLNASYNIGARYFIKAILKPYSETDRLTLSAKVPEVLVRTKQTLATLISLHEVNTSQMV